ncbi:MAG: metal-sensitive transcriptional regulator [Deltaproteobacteria bacterium]
MNEACENRREIVNRLNRIEGQIKGICRMVEDEKPCTEILVQISAARSALKNTGNLLIKKYCEKCISAEDKKDPGDILCEVLKMLEAVID